VATIGLLGRFALKLPGELDILTNWWIIGIAIALLVIEFFADDSLSRLGLGCDSYVHPFRPGRAGRRDLWRFQIDGSGCGLSRSEAGWP
jgi:hypothetical protein